MTFESRDSPSLSDAARFLGMSEKAIDPDFGAILIDPDAFQYAVRVTAAAVEAMESGDTAHGPFSDPKIATFGRKRKG